MRRAVLLLALAWVLPVSLHAEEVSPAPVLDISTTGSKVSISWGGDSRWVLQKAESQSLQQLGDLAFRDVDRAKVRFLDNRHDFSEPLAEEAFYRLVQYGTILPESRKANVLVLHGKAMDADWMDSAPICVDLEKALGTRANFFYAEAPHLQNPFITLYSRAWWDCLFADYEELSESVSYVIDFANNDIPGDVDLVIGYSQGGTLASHLLNLLDSGRDMGSLANVRNAIFVNSAAMEDLFPMYDLESLENPPDDYSASNINTMHLMANGDIVVLPQWSSNLANSYNKSVTITYSGDHTMSIGGATPFLLIDIFPDAVSQAVEDWIREN